MPESTYEFFPKDKGKPGRVEDPEQAANEWLDRNVIRLEEHEYRILFAGVEAKEGGSVLARLRWLPKGETEDQEIVAWKAKYGDDLAVVGWLGVNPGKTLRDAYVDMPDAPGRDESLTKLLEE
jgi:hypothetical protein